MKRGVYIIRLKGLIKIGATKKLNERMTALQPDEIIHFEKIHDCFGAESFIHSRYRRHRVKGYDYFRLALEDIDDIIEMLKCISIGLISPRVSMYHKNVGYHPTRRSA